MRILFLPGNRTSPSARFRIWQFVEPLRRAGHDVTVRVIKPERDWQSQARLPIIKAAHTRLGSLSRLLGALWLLRDAESFDIIAMNRDIVPELGISFLEPLLAKRNPHLVFDFDDAIHVGPREKKLRSILPHFALVTAGNAYLAEFASRLNPQTVVVPTVVDTDYYKPADPRAPGVFRVGWSGSRSTLKQCLPLVRNVITGLSQNEDFEFLVIADTPPTVEWEGVRMRYIKWTPQTEAYGLQQIDIGLMPLNDTPFERGKCGLKALQYMAMGIPPIVSPVGVNRSIVSHGETGFHCETDDQWASAIKTLLHNDDLRQTMGRAARKRVHEEYSLAHWLSRIMQLYQEVGSR